MTTLQSEGNLYRLGAGSGCNRSPAEDSRFDHSRYEPLDFMSAKRATSGSSGAGSSSEHALTNAIILIVALGWGCTLLIQKGRLTWPPLALLSSLSTLAGCLALVGPVILLRSGRQRGQAGRARLAYGGPAGLVV